MIKETHPVDDFFRKSLQDHKAAPSDAARSRFLEDAARDVGKGFSSVLRWYYLLGAAILVTSAAFLYSYFTVETPSAPQTNPISEAVVSGRMKTASETQPTKNQDTPGSEKNDASSSPQINITEKSTKAIVVNNRLIPALHPAGTSSRKEMSGNRTEMTNAQTNQSPLPVQPSDQPAVEVSSPASSEPLRQAVSEREPDKSLSANVTMPASPVKDGIFSDSANRMLPSEDRKTDLSGKKKPSSPVTFTPGFRYGLDRDLSGNNSKTGHTFSLEGTLQKGRFSVTTGAGLSVTNGYQGYDVTYNDYLGKYNRLDSITFNWDQKHYHLVPSYFTTETAVWDSTLKLDSYRVLRRYTLVRVPLTLGYEVLRMNRFTIGLKTGAEMTFYLNSKSLSGEYDAGVNKVVNLSPLSDDLNRTNLYLTGNLSAACNLTRRIVLEAEPGIQYLLNPSGSTALNTRRMIPLIRASVRIKF